MVPGRGSSAVYGVYGTISAPHAPSATAKSAHIPLIAGAILSQFRYAVRDVVLVGLAGGRSHGLRVRDRHDAPTVVGVRCAGAARLLGARLRRAGQWAAFDLDLDARVPGAGGALAAAGALLGGAGRGGGVR